MTDPTLEHLEFRTLKVKFCEEDIEKMKSMSLEERIEYKRKLKSEHRYKYEESEYFFYFEGYFLDGAVLMVNKNKLLTI